MSLDFDPVADSIREVYPYRVDLENCDVEPLRHIQVVQAHACLLGADTETFTVRYASENTDVFLGHPWEAVLDTPLRDILPADVVSQLALGLRRDGGFEAINPILTLIDQDGEQRLHNIIVHKAGAYLLIEIERTERESQTSQYQQLLARSVHRIQNISDPTTLFPQTAMILKQVSGYDRVMVYQFDRDYNGTVIAEARNEELESYEGLRYPHTDIPKQARELYLKNRVRLISGVTDIPARIHRSEIVQSDEPLDLSLVGSRGVSPVHLEYLGYMGVNNSLSIAIILNNKLWGLFALHHYAPHHVDYSVRNALMFIGQIFSGHLSLQATNRYREQTLNRKLARLSIGEEITKTQDIFEGLVGGNYSVLTMFPEVNGVAIHFEEQLRRLGDCPEEADIHALLAWIRNHGVASPDLYYENESIGKDCAPFERYCNEAAGVLIIFLNPSQTDYICWFRPGLVQKISWGGKPDKELIVSTDGTRRLGPRRSFARYVETVEGCSAPWSDHEVDAALALRITVINSLLQRYSEVKEINERLQKAYEDLETFSYTVSHDLRAPLRAINGYAEILMEDYGEEMDEDANGLIQGIQRGVDQMNNFITDILDLSRVGSSGLQLERVAPSEIVREVVEELRVIYLNSSDVEISVAQEMPQVMADRRLLRQLYMNLVSNALKYIQPNAEGKQAIRIGSYVADEYPSTVFTVSNTGPAIPEEFRRTIFDMFSRISTSSGQDGTGVGLAIVERIVERHLGRVWVDSDGLGVTFHFYLNAEDA